MRSTRRGATRATPAPAPRPAPPSSTRPAPRGARPRRGDPRGPGRSRPGDAAAVNIDEPQFIGVLGALRAELERRGGDLEAARAAIGRALDRIETCTDDVVRLARVAAAGVRRGRRRPARARPRRRRGAPRALCGPSSTSAARGAAAEDGGPVEVAGCAAPRPSTRAPGRPDPALHEAAAAGVGGGPAPLSRRADALARGRGARRRRRARRRPRPRSRARTRPPRRSAPAGCAARSTASRPARGSSARAATARRGPPPTVHARGSVRPHTARAPGPRARGRGRTNREIGD